MEKIKQWKIIVFSLFLAIGSIGMRVAGADVTVTSTPLAHPVLSLAKALDENPNTFVMILDGDGLVDGSKKNVGSVIEFDFGEVMDISGIGWLPRQDESTAQPKDFEVLVSSDHIAWDVALSVQNASPVLHPLEGGVPGTFADYAVDATGRYLRLHIIETYGNYAGYGPPYSLETSTNVQLAEIDWTAEPSAQVPAQAQVTSTPTAHEAFTLSNLFDGNLYTFAMINDVAGDGSVIDVDYGKCVLIDDIIWAPRQDMSVSQPKDFEVLVSDDGISWDVALSVQNATPVPISFESYARPDGLFATASYAVNAAGRYLKFHVIETYGDWPVCACGYPLTSLNLQLAELSFVIDETDSDGDGVSDVCDTCPNTPVFAIEDGTVGADGCVSCELLGGFVTDALVSAFGVPPVVKNHGEYVSFAAGIVDEYSYAGLITEECASSIMKPIAHSNVGKPGDASRTQPGKGKQ